MRIFILLAILFSLLAPSVSAQSSATNGANGYCVDFNMPKITAVIEAGIISMCIQFKDVGRIGDATKVSYTINGPVIHVAATVAGSLQNEVGCVETLEPPPTTSTIGTITAWSRYTDLLITDTTCTGSARITVSYLTTTIVDVHMAFTIVARDDVLLVDSLNRLCEASVHLAACNPVDFSSNTTVNGTFNAQVFTGNTSVNTTVNVAAGNGTADSGWDGSLYILVCIMIAVLWHLAAHNRDNMALIIAAVLNLIAAFILYWELDRIGFNNIGDNGIILAGVFMVLHLCLAGLLFIKSASETEKE